MRVLVTGATGLIGQALVARCDDVVVLSRSPDAARRVLPGGRIEPWNPLAGPPAARHFDGVDAVVHLAGEPIAGARWSNAVKRRIRDSRVQGTRQLVAGLAALSVRPRVLVSGSAIGYYGDRGEELLDESAEPGDGFLAEVCSAWESEARQAEALGMRVVRLRTGVVLAGQGGALPKMLPLFRLGLGGRIGHGAQWMSWIHIDDLVALIQHAVRHDGLTGPINGVSPAPVTNREFAATLAATLRRPAPLPVPAAALGLALGEMSGILTASQRVVPRAALEKGFSFRHDRLAATLATILSAR